MENFPFTDELEGLRAIFKTMPETVIMLDRDGQILYMNRVQEGRSMASVVGKDAREFIDPGSWDAFDAALETIWNGSHAEPFDMAVPNPRGVVEWHRHRAFPLRQDGRLVAALLIAQDVTALKAAERDRDRLRRLLPICAWCDRIQAETGEWQSIEVYLNGHSGTAVSHSLCPDCEGKQLGQAATGNGGGA